MRAAGALLDGVDLDVAAGEIVAIAGVSGNGQQALAELLSGTLAPDAGTIDARGPRRCAATPRAWIAAGVARIPEDRHAVGVIGDLAVWENAISERCARRRSRARASFAARRGARTRGTIVRRFDVRGSGIDVPARSLSGGNMQKLILGRALSVAGGATPVLIVADQPTWGLDIGAVAYVHQRLLDARARGAAVLLISEDLDEIFALADRIAVMHHGRLSARAAGGGVDARGDRARDGGVGRARGCACGLKRAPRCRARSQIARAVRGGRVHARRLLAPGRVGRRSRRRRLPAAARRRGRLALRGVARR